MPVMANIATGRACTRIDGGGLSIIHRGLPRKILNDPRLQQNLLPGFFSIAGRRARSMAAACSKRICSRCSKQRAGRLPRSIISRGCFFTRTEEMKTGSAFSIFSFRSIAAGLKARLCCLYILSDTRFGAPDKISHSPQLRCRRGMGSTRSPGISLRLSCAWHDRDRFRADLQRPRHSRCLSRRGSRCDRPPRRSGVSAPGLERSRKAKRSQTPERNCRGGAFSQNLA